MLHYLESHGLEKDMKDLLKLSYKGTPVEISVTGHSLGAAVASLYSFKLLKMCSIEKAKDGK